MENIVQLLANLNILIRFYQKPPKIKKMTTKKLCQLFLAKNLFVQYFCSCKCCNKQMIANLSSGQAPLSHWQVLTSGKKALPRTLINQCQSQRLGTFQTFFWPGHTQRAKAIKDFKLVQFPRTIAPFISSKENHSDFYYAQCVYYFNNFNNIVIGKLYHILLFFWHLNWYWRASTILAMFDCWQQNSPPNSMTMHYLVTAE